MNLGDNPELQRLARQSGGGGPNREDERRRERDRDRGGGTRGGASGGGRHESRQESDRARLPEQLVYATFYGDDGRLKLDLFFEAPERLASAFRNASVGARQLRALLTAFHRFAAPLENGRLAFEDAKVEFSRLYRDRVVRQALRRPPSNLPMVVKEFFDRHLDLALREEREMLGLYQYLLGVVCYFRGK